MKVALIGCGLVGQKRASGLGQHELVACVDPLIGRAESIARLHPGCVASSDNLYAVDAADIDIVIVATPHDSLASTAILGAEAGKHILVEKPAARSATELLPVLDAVERAGTAAKVGFNHRFHPALQQAHQIFESGGVGELLYIRGRYGHGGRPGYEREWRADPHISGGGELLDQGSHLIDLSRWFAGDFVSAEGHLAAYYWPMQVEDNAFVALRTASGQMAWLHASWTEWKNLFSFEVFGRHGKLEIQGLGGSYGVERLTYYRMLPELGPPETTAWEYPRADDSWTREFDHFVDCIESGREPSGSLRDALANLELVGQLYAGAR